MTNEQALNMAFEKLLGVEVPRRARWMRTLFAELQRVASHLLWLGTFALDLGGALGGGSTSSCTASASASSSSTSSRR
jgi:NADH:ubiquinone oxidoreductase subunit D